MVTAVGASDEQVDAASGGDRSDEPDDEQTRAIPLRELDAIREAWSELEAPDPEEGATVSLDRDAIASLIERSEELDGSLSVKSSFDPETTTDEYAREEFEDKLLPASRPAEGAQVVRPHKITKKDASDEDDEGPTVNLSDVAEALAEFDRAQSGHEVSASQSSEFLLSPNSEVQEDTAEFRPAETGELIASALPKALIDGDEIDTAELRPARLKMPPPAQEADEAQPAEADDGEAPAAAEPEELEHAAASSGGPPTMAWLVVAVVALVAAAAVAALSASWVPAASALGVAAVVMVLGARGVHVQALWAAAAAAVLVGAIALVQGWRASGVVQVLPALACCVAAVVALAIAARGAGTP